jgi:DegV family protein with EDD domain
LEGVDLTPNRYYRLVRAAENGFLPTATGPSLDAFVDLYTQLHKQTDQILSIHVSAHLSNAVEAAHTARRMLLGRCRIEVVDSQSTTVGLGYLVQAAAAAAAAGRDMDDCIRLVRGMMPHIYVFFLVKHLPYLEREGRISPAQSLLGTMLEVMPLLQIEEGEIIPLEKVRTSQHGIDKLFDYVSEFAQLQRAAILQHGFRHESEQLLERLELAYPEQEFPVLTCNPSLAVHLGPDAMGVVVLESITSIP